MAKFGASRVFPFADGTTEVVERHITLGHGARNLNQTFQIYWRPTHRGAVEVVYAGPHLPTVSGNT